MHSELHHVALATLFAICGLALCWVPSAGAAGSLGSLSQLAGTDGCISEDGSSDAGAATCADGRAIDSASSVSISPDGRFLYVGDFDHDGLAIFQRDPVTGKLTQLPGTDACITADGASDDGPGTCQDARAMFVSGYGPLVAFTPDGRFAYVAATGANAVLAFTRDPATGKLTQLPGIDGCISSDGSSPDDGANTCTPGTAIDPDAIVASPDGSSFYGLNTYADVSNNVGIAVFHREASGKLTQLAGLAGCVTTTGDSEDGAATCTNGRVVNYGNTAAISPDGRFLYLGAYDDNGISAFSRDTSSGALTQLPGTAGCVADGALDEDAQPCAEGRALGGVWAVTMSPDGGNLYAALYTRHGVATFARNATTGTLTQLPGIDGCVTSDGSSEDGPGTCGDGRGAYNTWLPTVSPDGLSLYTSEDSGGLTAFSRGGPSGALGQLPGAEGCLAKPGTLFAGGADPTCGGARAITQSESVVGSPDGHNLYAASYDSSTGGIGIFERQLPPSCSGRSVSSNGTAVQVPLDCTDVNRDPVSRSVVSPPAHGKLGPIDQTAGTVQYTPNAGFSGTDTFGFKASDGSLDSAAATAQLNVKDAQAASCRPAARVGVGQLRRNRLRITLNCSEASRVSVDLLLAAKTAKKLHLTAVRYRRIGKGTGRASKAGRVAVRVKLTRKAAKRIRRVSRSRLLKAKMAVRVRTVDLAANRSTRTLKLRTRR